MTKKDSSSGAASDDDRKRIMLTRKPGEGGGSRVASDSEFEVVQRLAYLTLARRDVDPEFQGIANAVVAKAFFSGVMPARKRGRPTNEVSDISFPVALHYYSLLDSGVGHAEAVAATSAKFHKGERHIMRLVQSGRSLVGETSDQRKLKRDWFELCTSLGKDLSEGERGLAGFRDEASGASLSEGTDPIASLDDLIRQLQGIKSDDKN